MQSEVRKHSLTLGLLLVQSKRESTSRRTDVYMSLTISSRVLLHQLLVFPLPMHSTCKTPETAQQSDRTLY